MRIKFIDTGEELEVTRAEQIRNTKVRVTPDTSRQIQEALFKLGIQWKFSGIQVVWTRLPFLFIERRIIMSGDTESYFEMQPNREFLFLSFLPFEPLTTPDNEPLSQPQQIQRGEITPEALEAEGWEKKLTSDTGYKLYLKGGIIVWFYRGALEKIALWSHKMEGVSTLPDLRTLDRLVNGVAIPSTTNN